MEMRISEGGEIMEVTCKNHRLNEIAILRCLNLKFNDIILDFGGIYTKKKDVSVCLVDFVLSRWLY